MVHSSIVGLVLAGGLARRMDGADKPLMEIAGRPMLDRVLARLAPQCGAVVLNANGDPARFAALGLPVVADSIADYPGPLAGILAGLDWTASERPDATWIVSAPADCPFLPRDLVTRLMAARLDANTPIACPASGGRLHPIVGLWPVASREALRIALAQGMRKVEDFAASQGLTTVEWPATPFDPFFNVNTPEDRAKAETLARTYPDA